MIWILCSFQTSYRRTLKHLHESDFDFIAYSIRVYNNHWTLVDFTWVIDSYYYDTPSLEQLSDFPRANEIRLRENQLFLNHKLKTSLRSMCIIVGMHCCRLYWFWYYVHLHHYIRHIAANYSSWCFNHLHKSGFSPIKHTQYSAMNGSDGIRRCWPLQTS